MESGNDGNKILEVFLRTILKIKKKNNNKNNKISSSSDGIHDSLEGAGSPLNESALVSLNTASSGRSFGGGEHHAGVPKRLLPHLKVHSIVISMATGSQTSNDAANIKI